MDTKHQFIALDGLRGIAAFAVIGWHWKTIIPGLPDMQSGYLSVDLFFLLSGFVLAHAYWTRLCSDLAWAAFMRIRIVRLYPLYFLALCIATAHAALSTLAGVHPPSVALTWTNVATGLLFLPNPMGVNLSPLPNLYPWNPAAWSLFFELIGNAAFAFFAAKLSGLTLKAIVGVSAVLLVGTGFYYGSLIFGWGWPNILGGFPRVFFSFFLGIIIYKMRSEGRLPALINSWAFPALHICRLFSVMG